MGVYRAGRNRAYGSDQNHGYPCELLRVGDSKTWKVVGEPVHVHVPIDAALTANGVNVFTAIGKAYAVVAVSEVHRAIETTAATSNLKVERLQGTEKVAEGDDLIAATELDLENVAVDTVQNGTVLATSDINVLAEGNRLCLHAALDDATPTALTEYRGCVSIHLVPVTLDDASTS